MKTRLALLTMLLAAPAFAATVRDAHACGACFHPPPQPNEVESVVTDHRMVFAISTSQTVLWDQIRYSGDPTEFAWVLPVHPGARVELSNDAWISALEASTDVVVSPPPVNCPVSSGGSSGGLGCGSSAAASGASFAPGGGGDTFDSGAGVQVISQNVVGPYETVTIRASQGDALETWLTSNGFAVPQAMEPTLAAYAQEGFDFIALKLRPGQGVRAMQPVRVVTPGADASLPLRMVAGGIGAQVGLTLYVVGEGRYRVQNFPNVHVDASQIAWDPYAARSNYADLAEGAMTGGDGRGWLTEYATQPDLSTYGSTTYGAPNPPLGATYRALCTPSLPIACDAGAPSDDGGDGGSASCPPPPPACDDLDLATGSLHAGDIWVTRLRAHLPANALAVGDLRLEADPTQAPISNRLTAAHYSVATYNPCASPPNGSGGGADSGCACTTARDDRGVGTWVLAGVTAMAVSAIMRRIGARRRR